MPSSVFLGISNYYPLDLFLGAIVATSIKFTVAGSFSFFPLVWQKNAFLKLNNLHLHFQVNLINQPYTIASIWSLKRKNHKDTATMIKFENYIFIPLKSFLAILENKDNVRNLGQLKLDFGRYIWPRA